MISTPTVADKAIGSSSSTLRAPSTSRPTSTVQLKSSLRGHSYDEQIQLLSLGGGEYDPGLHAPAPEMSEPTSAHRATPRSVHRDVQLKEQPAPEGGDKTTTQGGDKGKPGKVHKKWFFGKDKQETVPKHDASGFSDKEKKQLSKAVIAALPMVTKGLAMVKKGGSHYIRWMDKLADSKSTDAEVDRRIEHVKAGLEAVKKCLENDEIKFKPYALNDGEEEETYAYVQSGEVEKNIYLGGAFWSFWTWTKGKNSKAGTIIHELTHKLHATKDHAYGTGDCRELAKTDPDKATTNADNYEFLCETA